MSVEGQRQEEGAGPKDTSLLEEGERAAEKPEPPQEIRLPEFIPPETKTSVSFNQLNFYQQIPSGVWDRLSEETVAQFCAATLEDTDRIGKRHFDYAMDDAHRSERASRRSIVAGSIIACCGIASTVYLVSTGHEIVALTISLPLATIISILVGRGFLK